MSKTIVSLFVNRERIHESFLDMIEGSSEKQIMLIKAEGGMGKSWLTAKLRHECSIHAPVIAYTLLDFRDGQAHDYLSIVRRARDDLGAAQFNQLTHVINSVTELKVNLQINSEIAGQASAHMSDVTNSEVIVAGNSVIKDNFFLIQVDSESARREIETKVTSSFLDCLSDNSRVGKTVFFYDTYEKASPTTRQWLENQLLLQIREGNLPNIIIVIAGREIPELDLSWKHCATRPKLEALDSQHVAAYLHEKRGLTDVDAETLYRATLGNPQLLGLLADNLAASHGDDDDW